MRAILLLLIAATVSSPLLAQERRELFTREWIVPPRFVPAKELKAPTTAQRDALKKEAAEWVTKRAKVKAWKMSRFEFLGEFHGKPADYITAGVYQVYRMKFQATPQIAGELQTDLLFYCQEKLVVWPPESWSVARAPPGQMNAVVRSAVRE